jgi:hypothetical protein
MVGIRERQKLSEVSFDIGNSFVQNIEIVESSGVQEMKEAGGAVKEHRTPSFQKSI